MISAAEEVFMFGTGAARTGSSLASRTGVDGIDEGTRAGEWVREGILLTWAGWGVGARDGAETGLGAEG